jgi:transcriptional regulator with XRE-family HTH domain
MAPTQDVLLQLRRLRADLRKLRTTRNLTQRDVADSLDWSLSKLIRMESGSVGISTTDLKALLQHYDVSDKEEIDRFVDMARASKEQRDFWWSGYREATSQQYLTFLGYENSASAIFQFETLLIPGLLQEEEYAREVLAAYGGSASQQRMNEWVELRLRRQYELFERPHPPEMLFVLDEAALLRWVGGPKVMRRQLNRLRTEAARDHVTIEIVPFSAGAHPGMKGSFVILEFDEDVDDVLYLENSRGDMVSRDDQGEVKEYREAFEQLQTAAAESNLTTMIDKALSKLSD